MSVDWKARGRFVAHLKDEDLKELGEEFNKKDKLSCILCGKNWAVWITDIRVSEGGETRKPGEVHGMSLCDEHGEPLMVALKMIRLNIKALGIQIKES